MSNRKSCTVEYDGASKGNPGRSGAGAVIRDSYGNETYLQQGLGNATNNQAEYHGLNLGLEYAASQGYEHVQVRGDSQLVTKQVQGEWRVRDSKMSELCTQTNQYKSQFKSFDIQHVPREYNSAADSEANRGTYLADGETKVNHGNSSGYRGW